ncbi:hypothetical protein HD806DRAFT_538299 [Xylariaceae sp. AK1471]|nr:hypothetical protein HD806DRAFT_538299 [Xylariaceae sp. AK1471]
MELSAHQLSLEPFGAWANPSHMRHPQDMDLATRARHPQLAVSAPSSPPSRYTLTREVSKCGDGTNKGPPSGGGSRSVAASPDAKRGSRSWPASPKSQNRSQPQKEAKHEPQATKPGVVRKRVDVEEGNFTVIYERLPIIKHAPFELSEPGNHTFTLPLRSAKRVRASHDVDGPGTNVLSCKKRRLLLHLVTSRLSRPFSLPATHILIRESSDNMPVLHRIQQLACLGARRVGHQSSLVRKAAILNRIRIRVRQAAVSRGHTIMADLAARGNALNHGLQLVTTPSSVSMGARFPGVEMNGNGHGHGHVNNMAPTALGSVAKFVPPSWRPHTTSFHPPIDHTGGGGIDMANQTQTQSQTQTETQWGSNQGVGISRHNSNTSAAHKHKETLPEPARILSSAPRYTPPIHIPPPKPTYTHTFVDISDEEDNTAFPAANFHDRYADLSDDDMDDVYADFGVLFGSGSRSPETRAVGSPVEEQFFEEYLDELDGIPWVA